MVSNMESKLCGKGDHQSGLHVSGGEQSILRDFNSHSGGAGRQKYPANHSTRGQGASSKERHSNQGREIAGVFTAGYLRNARRSSGEGASKGDRGLERRRQPRFLHSGDYQRTSDSTVIGYFKLPKGIILVEGIDNRLPISKKADHRNNSFHDLFRMGRLGVSKSSKARRRSIMAIAMSFLMALGVTSCPKTAYSNLFHLTPEQLSEIIIA